MEELDHDIKSIKQPSSQLKLGGFTASANGVYAYRLDFDGLQLQCQRRISPLTAT